MELGGAYNGYKWNKDIAKEQDSFKKMNRLDSQSTLRSALEMLVLTLKITDVSNLLLR